jgi:hypothetical protein
MRSSVPRIRWSRLAHALIRFFKLFGDPIETFAGLSCQIGDEFLQRNLILRDELDYLLQTVYSLSDGFFRHGGIISRLYSPGENPGG